MYQKRNPNRKHRIIIFDFDGVISDTDEGRFAILKPLLNEYGISLDGNFTKNDLSGLTTDSFLRSNFNYLSDIQIKNIIKKRRKIYLQNLSKYCVPIDGALELINKYTDKTELYLATTNDREITESLIAHLSLQKAFKSIFCRDDVEIENSTLKNYNNILSVIGKNSKDCIVIEDSEVGVISSINAGIITVKFGEMPISDKVKPDFTVNSYADLDKLLVRILEY